jgi:signal transduction histidine kinase
VHSLARAITLCERTLAYGRVEEAAPELAVIGVAALASEVVEGERLAAADSCVEIATDIPSGLKARADADQLYRVLSNLVRNAVQAIDGTHAAGRVTISGEDAAGRTVIRVSDNGPGLPPKAREHLFQPFRGGVRQGGSGLGLVISSELVRLHGGSLTLAETGPGGTTFRIELPAP